MNQALKAAKRSAQEAAAAAKEAQEQCAKARQRAEKAKAEAKQAQEMTDLVLFGPGTSASLLSGQGQRQDLPPEKQKRRRKLRRTKRSDASMQQVQAQLERETGWN